MTPLPPSPRCQVPVDNLGSTCNRVLIGNARAPFCPVHDRVECTAAVNGRRCGYRLVNGREIRCPMCGSSVKLQDVLRKGPTT